MLKREDPPTPREKDIDFVRGRLTELLNGTVSFPREEIAEEIVDYFTAVAEEEESHTKEELYMFRMIYNAWAFLYMHKVLNLQGLRSTRHHPDNDELDEGWFIVQIQTSEGVVSNHYKKEYWDYFSFLPTSHTALHWDGYNSSDVLERLMSTFQTHAKANHRQSIIDEMAMTINGHPQDSPESLAERIYMMSQRKGPFRD